MDHIEPNVVALLWFVLLWSICCLGFLQLAGMYPIDQRSADGMEKSRVLVLGNTVIWLALLTGTIAFALAELRWTTIVVVSGILFLFLPEAFQAVPSHWRDGRLGMAAAGCILLAALGTLISVGAAPIRLLLT